MKKTTANNSEEDSTSTIASIYVGMKKEEKVDEELGKTNFSIDDDDDNDDTEIDSISIQLPSDKPNGSRLVPGACAICLSTYQVGDQISWSTSKDCQHAFHKDCIIPWLAKKTEETKCPCCRQSFCHLRPVKLEDLLMISSPPPPPLPEQHQLPSSSTTTQEGLVIVRQESDRAVVEA